MQPKALYSLMVAAATLLLSYPATADTEVASGEIVSVFGAGDLTVPAKFKRVKPKSAMVQHEFEASGKSADGGLATARITMMSAGGDIKSNVRRWKGQFAGGDKAKNRVEQVSAGEWEIHIVDVNGSFAERMGGPFAGGKTVNHEDYAMAGGILVHADGRMFFVKMIGPDQVVNENREEFVAMLKSIGNE